MANAPARDYSFVQVLTDSNSSYARFALNHAEGTLISIDGEELAFPKGCKAVLIQPRKCGDYYAEIEGVGFSRSAIGESIHEAARAVAQRVPA